MSEGASLREIVTAISSCTRSCREVRERIAVLQAAVPSDPSAFATEAATLNGLEANEAALRALLPLRLARHDQATLLDELAFLTELSGDALDDAARLVTDLEHLADQIGLREDVRQALAAVGDSLERRAYQARSTAWLG